MGPGGGDNSMFTPKRDERTAVADTSTHAAGITSHPLSQTRLDGFARAAAPAPPRAVIFDLLHAAQDLSYEALAVLAGLLRSNVTCEEVDAGAVALHARAVELAALSRALRILLDLRGEP